MKTIRKKFQGHKMVGFKNIMVTYGKNFHGKYRIELSLSFGLFRDDSINLYTGVSKPRFKNINLIALLALPYVIPYIIVVPIAFYLMRYIVGFKNFLENSVDVTDVRFFSWINLTLLILLFINFIFNR